MKIHLLLTLCLFISCNNFENKFFNELEEANNKYEKTKIKQIFDFTKITNFDWDYFQYIRGNESVPIFSNEIERDLKLNFKTADLDLNKTRFYFYKDKKLIREIEINTPDFKTPYFTFKFCKSNKINKSESIFYLTKASETILQPSCNQ